MTQSNLKKSRTYIGSRLWQMLALVLVVFATSNKVAAQPSNCTNGPGTEDAVAQFNVSSSVICAGQSVIVDFSGFGETTVATNAPYNFQNNGTNSFTWCFDNDGSASLAVQGLFDPNNGAAQEITEPTITFTTPGVKTIRLMLIDGNDPGSAWFFTRQITVLPAPVTDFTLSTNTLCNGASVTLNPSYSPASGTTLPQPDEAIITYNWDFGGGFQVGGTEANPIVGFTLPGTYTVTLTNIIVTSIANGAQMCASGPAFSRQVVVLGNPTSPFFVPNANDACVNVGTQLVYTGDATILNPALVTYNWGFDGGTMVGGAMTAPQVKWTTSGIKNVTLSVSVFNQDDNTFCTGPTTTVQVNVRGGITDFTAVPQAACLGEVIYTFTGTPPTAGAQVVWDFGTDVNLVQNLGDPNLGPWSVTYTTGGTKTSTLTITDGTCVSAPVMKMVDVTVGPTADFVVTNTECFGTDPAAIVTSTITYLGNPGSSATGTTLFTWDFAGGAVMAGNPADPTAGPITVEWNTPGNKMITLTTGLNGCGDTQMRTVEVYNSYSNTVTISDQVCLTGTAAQTTEAVITYTGSAPVGAADAFYEWDFDGGIVVSGNLQNPKAGAGQIRVIWNTTTNNVETRNVRLRVRRGTNCLSEWATVTTTITPLRSSFVAGNQFCSNILSVIFNGVGRPGTTQFSWDWNNGVATPVTAPTNFNVEYQTIGPKVITLLLQEGACSHTSNQTVTVGNGINLGEQLSQFAVTSPICVTGQAVINYTGTSTGPGDSFTWDFGGGSIVSGSGSGPYTVTWSNSGTKVVTLTVSNANGCTTSARNIVVADQPSAQFLIDAQNSACRNEVLSLVYQGNAMDASDWEFIWNFDGGTQTNASKVNPTVFWTTPGVKTVTLQVNRVNGTGGAVLCQSTVFTRTVNIIGASADFNISSTSLCNNDSILVTYTGNGNGTQQAYTWNFGDGIALNMSQNNDPRGPWSIKYPSAGDRTISLVTVFQSGGGVCASAPYSRTLNVFPAPTANFHLEGNACFNGDNSVQSSTVRLFYTGNVEANPADVNSIQYYWDFAGGVVTGNGQANQQDPKGDGVGENDFLNIHWTTPGMKIISLRVKRGDGCMSTVFSDTVMVTKISANFTVSVVNCGANEAIVTFNGMAGPMALYNWDFGGAIATNMSGLPEGPYLVKYNTPTGNKTVSLQVMENGCMNAFAQQFNVNHAPSATFTVGSANVCQVTGGTVADTQGSSAVITYSGNAHSSDILVWNFDGGVVVAGVAPTSGINATAPFTVRWDTPGAKAVSLTAMSANGVCSNSSQFGVNVNPRPTASFNVSDACFGNSALITYTGNGTPGAVYTWTFQNGMASPGVGQGPHVVNWQSGGNKTVTLSVSENGCTSATTATSTVAIGSIFTSTFTSPAGPVCAGSAVTLSHNGTAPVNGPGIYTWDFGGGSQIGGTATQPVVEWASAGTKTVSLVVSDQTGCTSSITTRVVNVVNSPTASFNVSVPDCSSNIAYVQFTGSASAGATYSWNFNGGTIVSGNGAGPFTIKYNTAGTKTLGLTVNDGGCADVAANQFATVSLPMSADFTTGTGNVCVNATRVLSATNYAGAVYIWNFGEGSNQVGGTNIAPQVQWNTPGIKTISLAVAMNNCTTAVTSKVLNVSGPVADFAVSTAPCSSTNTASVTFTGMGGAGATYNWNFGGGVITNSGTGAGPYTLNYPTAGTKTITLQVSMNGCQSTVASQVFTVGAAIPNSNFTAPSTACANTNAIITYTGNAPSPNTNGVSYTWNFGDGNVVGGTHPSYNVQWSTPGMKTVTLVISNNGCVSATTTRFVMVRSAVSADFVAPSPVCQGQTSVVAYTGTAPSTAIYNWNFGAGASVISSSFPNYSVNWATSGTKTITLTVIDGGCTATATRTVEVVNNSSLSASFTASPSTICQNGSTTVTYNGNAGANALYTWNFAGGNAVNMSENNDPRGPYSVSWATIGPRTISLTIAQNNCLSSIVTQSVNVTQGLSSHFTASSQVCIGAGAVITYNGVAPANATFSWNFAGGVATPGVGPGPHTVTWTTGGAKDVSLFITEPGVNGCISPVTTRTVDVIPAVNANFTVSSPICSGGSATVTYIGNAGPSAIFTWNFDGGLATGNGAGPFVVTWPTNGNKVITLNVQDACNNRTSTQTAYVGASFSATASATNETCASMGSISAMGVGGTGIYTYSIDGVNFTNNSTFQNVAAGSYTVTVKDISGCSATADVMVAAIPTVQNFAVQASSITANQALITWNPTDAASGYEVRFRAAGANSFTTVNVQQNTQYLITGLEANTNYEAQVRAFCSAGRASTWAVVPFQTNNLGSGNCITPIGLFASQVTANSVTLNWTPNQGGAVCYIIAVGPLNTNPNLWSQVLVPHPGNTVTINNLTPGVEYGARIRTNCSLCSATSGIRTTFSSNVVFTTSQLRDGAATVASANVADIKVYPNPNKGIFTVSFDAAVAGQANVQVTDVTGRVVYTKSFDATVGANDLAIDLTSQPAGVYMLQFKQGAEARVVKVVVN